jgi:hypothetical protein
MKLLVLYLLLPRRGYSPQPRVLTQVLTLGTIQFNVSP